MGVLDDFPNTPDGMRQLAAYIAGTVAVPTIAAVVAQGAALGGVQLTGAPDPVNDGDVSNKDYVDDAVAALPAALVVRQGAGVPAGAPAGNELPVAVDTTASPGTIYVWSGAAWLAIT